jgi:hypothetical protein
LLFSDIYTNLFQLTKPGCFTMYKQHVSPMLHHIYCLHNISPKYIQMFYNCRYDHTLECPQYEPPGMDRTPFVLRMPVCWTASLVALEEKKTSKNLGGWLAPVQAQNVTVQYVVCSLLLNSRVFNTCLYVFNMCLYGLLCIVFWCCNVMPIMSLVFLFYLHYVIVPCNFRVFIHMTILSYHISLTGMYINVYVYLTFCIFKLNFLIHVLRCSYAYIYTCLSLANL